MWLKTSSALITLLICSPMAHALLITDQVASRDNLYQTAWGHAWDDGINTTGANAARAIKYQDSAFDFSGYDILDISASGFVVDACDWTNDSDVNWEDYCKTDADGAQLIDDAWFHDLYWTADGLFRGHDVYSLIGVWSSSANSIDPISDTFQVGAQIQMFVPEITGSRYLFLANNDGLFDDNLYSYDILISTSVPAPPAIALFALGLVSIVLRRRTS
jgi:hypothetical protein